MPLITWATRAAYQPMTDHQEIAMRKLRSWWRGGNREYRLGGYAGSGKTALIAHLPEILGVDPDDLCYATPTNPARLVLEAKLPYDNPAGVSTIHSLRTKYDDEKHCFVCDAPGGGKCHVPGAKPNKKCICHEPDFREKLDVVGGLIVVDEASMVTKQMMGWLRNSGARLLFVGDPAQLLPVDRLNPGFSAIRGKLDYEMVTPVRQKADSSIIKLATLARERRWGEAEDREGARLLRPGEYKKGLKRLNWSDEDTPESLIDQVVIVGKHETRNLLNAKARQQLGFVGAYPVPGDMVVMKTNDYKQQVFNGQRGVVREISRRLGIMEVRMIGGDLWRGKYDPRVFDPSAEPPSGWAAEWEYAYAITCHVAQGGEWDCVTVVRDGWGDGKPERWNWLYTAITRAKSELVVIG